MRVAPGKSSRVRTRLKPSPKSADKVYSEEDCMRPGRGLVWGWLIAGILAMVAPALSVAQTSSDFVYVFPKFSADPSAELILSNLSPRLATADIFFYDPTGGVSAVYAEIPANGQLRGTPDLFAAHGARSFDGRIV